ncbi:hypothetical protein AK830_g3751 [Neonectria ditissima]|uniref:ceramidase n=1 Tax=Neonectria ditissima TaxID=78410 RepID=A0A0P7BPJ1_9HYPO|nr:hypothetical protein AK830_g3751 [Neonectria ditissima]
MSPSPPSTRSWESCTTEEAADRGEEIPKLTIDLSQPPRNRYDHIIPHFREVVEHCDLPRLFYDILDNLAGETLGKCLGVAARVALRRLYKGEESAEIAGISKAIGVPMHILVALNVLLDLLLGCTSGGVRVNPNGTDSDQKTRMLHFRTLDWGMDPLRKIVVELDFVRSPGGPVVATTVTYLGYVGVLTGVRKGLSMSLNFRPYHDQTTLRARAAFRWQQAMVLLGFRQSISSVLRGFLLDAPRSDGGESRKGPTVEQASERTEELQESDIAAILDTLSSSPSTAAYLILCTADRVFVVEKDHRRASIRTSDIFLTAYNHDATDETNPAHLQQAASELAKTETGMADIVEFSLDRKKRMDEMWKKGVRAGRRRRRKQANAVTLEDVKQFVGDSEISNEETHYAVIMDPGAGEVIWRTAYEVERMPLSYEPCRERKILCPRNTNLGRRPCETCIRRGIPPSECVSLRDLHVSRQCANPPQVDTSALVSRINKLEELLQSHVGTQLHTANEPDNRSHFPSPESSLQLDSQTGFPDSGTVESLSPTPATSSVGRLIRSGSGHECYEPLSSRWSSILRINPVTSGLKGDLDGGDPGNPFPLIMQSVGTHELLSLLPPLSPCDELKDIFFGVYAPLFHVLRDPTFDAAYSRFREESNQISLSWLALLFAILSVAITAVPEENTLLQELGRCKTASENISLLCTRYRAAAMKCLEADHYLSRHNLHTLQTLVLLIYGINHTHGQSWALLETARNIALSLGHHVHPNSFDLDLITAEK